jgi:hypothetical protein
MQMGAGNGDLQPNTTPPEVRRNFCEKLAGQLAGERIGAGRGAWQVPLGSVGSGEGSYGEAYGQEDSTSCHKFLDLSLVVAGL